MKRASLGRMRRRAIVLLCSNLACGQSHTPLLAPAPLRPPIVRTLDAEEPAPPAPAASLHPLGRDVGPAELQPWLNQVHARVHPIYADQELEKLDALPATDPRNDPRLETTVQLTVMPRSGALERIEISRSSGVEAFDEVVLASFRRAAPFAPAPANLVSADYRVHVSWVVRRAAAYSCSAVDAKAIFLGR